jgi:hypothetical protein
MARSTTQRIFTGTNPGVPHALYSFRLADNTNLLEWLSFPHLGTDYGVRLTSFLSAIERLGINKEELDLLADVYPAPGKSVEDEAQDKA